MNKSTQALMFSSETDMWATPQAFFDKCNEKYGPFTLDVCATPENAKCFAFITEVQDGLKSYWSFQNGGTTCWMNPPYGRGIGAWVEKAYNESLKGNKVCCLLPARTDTKWFHEFCVKGQVILLKGRLKFGDATASAPFPSMIVLFGYDTPSITAGL